MKKTLFCVMALLIAFSLCACHRHMWVDANCTAPKTCSDCGETVGAPAGHIWRDATCIAPKTCSFCGKTEGTPTCHSWNDATCVSPKTCASCGQTEGTTINHSWKDATCTSPKTCVSCGKTDGTTISHSWKDATCTSPKTCVSCGKTEGAIISHSWKNVTCTAPKTCSSCGKTEGTALGHNWQAVNAYTKQCTTCGAQEIDQSNLPLNLGNLKPCTGDNYYSSSKTLEDIYGNKFTKGLIFHFGTSIGTSWKYHITEYTLNREYKTFTTKILINSKTQDKFEGDLKIYVDDVLKYDSGTMNKKTQPINIEIDISNAMFLKIETTRPSLGYIGYILMSDPLLHR